MIEIKNKFGDVLYTYNGTGNISDAVLEAAENGVMLSDSVLKELNLSNANISGVNFSGSNISDSKIENSNLSQSEITDAKLKGSDLSGSDFSDSDLTGSNFKFTDLTDTNFSAANLSGAKLQHSTISNATFDNATLTGAKLVYAEVEGSSFKAVSAENANFKFASLQETDFSGSTLNNARFEQANLHKANLSNVEAQNSFFKNADLSEANLSGADLTGANLKNANLSGADLTGANLSSVNLEGADLSGAKLEGAILSNAKIFEASLHDADLTNADLSGAKLNKADFSNSDLTDANLSNSTLNKADLSYATLVNVDFSGAKIQNASFTGADLTGANFSGANLKGSDLSGAILIDTNFEDANLNQVDFTDAEINNTNFDDASMRKVDFSNGDFSDSILTNINFKGADFTNSNLANSDFSGSNLKNADFTGANLTGTVGIDSVDNVITIENNFGQVLFSTVAANQQEAINFAANYNIDATALNNATFSGPLSEYQITINPDGSVTVTDNVDGRDGSIILDGAENFIFQGNQYSSNDVSNIVNSPANEPVPLDNGNYYIGAVDNLSIVLDSVSSNAGYNNSFGHYFTNGAGEPTEGVLNFSNVKDSLGEGEASTKTYTKSEIPAGSEQVGFFLIPNGDRLNDNLQDNIPVNFNKDDNGNYQAVSEGEPLNGQGANIFFSAASLNEDNFDYFQVNENGEMLIRAEDLAGGGDQDFNDVVVSFKVEGEIIIDTADFSGPLSEYQIVLNNDESVTINDTVDGRDGSITLQNVLNFNFAGNSYSNTDIVNIANSSGNEPVALTNGNYYIGAVSDLNVALDSLSSNAGYNNSFGHYFTNDAGEPTEGVLNFSNVKDTRGEGEASVTTYSASQIPAGSEQLGFFLIANGDRLNSNLQDDIPVTFSKDTEGNYQALSNGQPLKGQGANVFFTDSSINEGNFNYFKVNSDGEMKIKAEDLFGGGDQDFNDVIVSFDVTSTQDENLNLLDNNGNIIFSDSVDNEKELVESAINFGVDLSNADLSSKDLSGADLGGVNLSSANLTGSILTGANLTGANLPSNIQTFELYDNSDVPIFVTVANSYAEALGFAANFGVNTDNAVDSQILQIVDNNGGLIVEDRVENFQELVSETIVKINNGQDISLANANLSGNNLSAVDFSGQNLSGANLSGTNIPASSLSGANLTSAALPSGVVTFDLYNNQDVLVFKTVADTYADALSAAGNFINTSNIVDSNIESIVNVDGTNIVYQARVESYQELVEEAISNNISLANANLSGNNLSAIDFSGQNLSGANLSGTNIPASSLSGANLTSAALPAGVVTFDLYNNQDVLVFKTVADTYNEALTIAGNFIDNTSNIVDSDIESIVNVDGSTIVYQARVESYKELVEEAISNNISLANANLSGNNLPAVDFSGQDLSGANLSGTNIPASSLSGANLTSAALPAGVVTFDLYNNQDVLVFKTVADTYNEALTIAGNFIDNTSNIVDSDIESIVNVDGSTIVYQARVESYKELVEEAISNNISLANANLSGNNLPAVDFSGQDLSGANLSGTNIPASSLSGANLTSAALPAGVVTFDLYNNQDVLVFKTVADTYNEALTIAGNFIDNTSNIVDSDIESIVNVDGSTIVYQARVESYKELVEEAISNNISLANANLSGNNLPAVDFSGQDLSGANLSGTNIPASSLSGANLTSAALPAGVVTFDLYNNQDVLVFKTVADTYNEALTIAGNFIDNTSNIVDSDIESIVNVDGSTIVYQARVESYKELVEEAISNNISLANANLSGNNLPAVDFSGQDLSGANLSGTNIPASSLSGANLTSAALPAGVVTFDLYNNQDVLVFKTVADTYNEALTIAGNFIDNTSNIVDSDIESIVNVDGSTIVYQARVESYKELVEEAISNNISLANANLSGNNLPAVDFSGQDLSGANLSGTNIPASSLSGANLTSAALPSGVVTFDLYNNQDVLVFKTVADTYNEALTIAGNFIDNTSNIVDSDIESIVNVDGSTIVYQARVESYKELVEEAISNNISLANANLSGNNLPAVDFSGQDLSGANLSGTNIPASSLSGANLTSAALPAGVVTFDLYNNQDVLVFKTVADTYNEALTIAGNFIDNTSNIVDSDIESIVNVDGSTIVYQARVESYKELVEEAISNNISLANANLSGNNLPAVDFSGQDLSGANLSGTNIPASSLSGANLTSAALPAGVVTFDLVNAQGNVLFTTVADNFNDAVSFANNFGVDTSSAVNLQQFEIIANDGVTVIYQALAASYAEMVQKAVDADTSLANANFSGRDLSTVDLTSSNLAGANLTGAVLPNGIATRDIIDAASPPNILFTSAGTDVEVLEAAINLGVDLTNADLADFSQEIYFINGIEAVTAVAASMPPPLKSQILNTGGAVIYDNGSPTTDIELVENAVSNGASFFNANLDNYQLSGINLFPEQSSLLSLDYAKLNNADLSFSNLTSVGLYEAELRRADFTGATLDGGTILSESELREADFTGATLDGVTLSNADLDFAQFGGANINGVRFIINSGINAIENVDFSNAIIANSSFERIKIVLVDFSGADLSNNVSFDDVQTIENTDFTGANLTNTSFRPEDIAAINPVNIIDTNGNTIFTSAGTDVEVVQAAVNFNVDLSNADLANQDLNGVDLSGADLSGASLTGASLSGANLTGTTLPTNPAITTFDLVNAQGDVLFTTVADNFNDAVSFANNFGVDTSSAVNLQQFEIIANDGVTVIYQALVESYAEMVQEAINNNVSLADANFSNQDLRGVDLSTVDLSSTDLTGANLTGSTLPAGNEVVNLTGTNGNTIFTSVGTDAEVVQAAVNFNVDLSDADLANQDISGVDLSGADLSGASLSGANLTGTTLPTNPAITTFDLVNAQGDVLFTTVADNFNDAVSFANNFGVDTSSAVNLQQFEIIANDGVTVIYQALVESYAEMVQEAVDADTSLANANFSGRDLSTVDLTSSNLAGANLTGAVLPNGIATRDIIDAASPPNILFTSAGTDVEVLEAAINLGVDLTNADLADFSQEIYFINGIEAVTAVAASMPPPLKSQILNTGGAVIYDNGSPTTDIELVENAVSNGASFFNANLDNYQLSGINLFPEQSSLLSLDYAKLNNADLSFSNLTSVGLYEAELRRADFTGATLDGGTILSESELREADFTGATLDGVTLSNADLDFAQFGGANINGVRFIINSGINAIENVDFSNAIIANSSFERIKIVLVDFSGADLSNNVSFDDVQTIENTDFTGANLTNTSFRPEDIAAINPVNIIDTNGNTIFTSAGTDVEVVQAAVNFNVDLSNADLANQDLNGVDLSGADLSGASLTGANLTGAVLPNGIATRDIIDAASPPNILFTSAGTDVEVLKAAINLGVDLTNADLADFSQEIYSIDGIEAVTAVAASMPPPLKSQVFDINGNLIYDNGEETTDIELFENVLSSNISLRNANFDNYQVSDADFSSLPRSVLIQNASLQNVNFSFSQFNRFDFTQSNLTEADFTGAEFSEFSFNIAKLNSAKFIDATFTSFAVFSFADLSEADFTGANFLAGFDLIAANLTNTVFDPEDEAAINPVNILDNNGDIIFTSAGTDLDVIQGAREFNIDLSNADLSNKDLSFVFLNDFNLTNANLAGANLTTTTLPADVETVNIIDNNGNVIFISAGTDAEVVEGAVNFSVKLSNADLSSKDLSGADLERQDLSGADLSGADLSGANLTTTTLPAEVETVKITDTIGITIFTSAGTDVEVVEAAIKFEVNLSNADLSSFDEAILNIDGIEGTGAILPISTQAASDPNDSDPLDQGNDNSSDPDAPIG